MEVWLPQAVIAILIAASVFILYEVWATRRRRYDVSLKSGVDRKRIDISADYECRYWTEKFGVSNTELKRAVQKVGPMADDVARELGKAA